MRTASGLLVATGFNPACASDGTTPTETGSVQVLVSGLDPSAADGGSVTVTAVDVVFDQFTVPLPASGDSGVKSGIPVGHYKGSYTPPANHALAPGETNPKDATISSGQTTVVTWSVVAAQGTVRVNVTGLAGGAANGGSASVLRTDIAGQSPVNLNIPASGSADLGVTIGTYQVTYTPPSGYTLNGGVQNPQSINVGSGQVGTVTFGVTVSGSTYQTPDVVNNASFETGWDGFTNASFQDPVNCTRDTAHAYNGSYGVKRALPVTSGSDIGGGLDYGFYFVGPAKTYDRIWTRFYFYLDAAVDGILKFHQLYSPSYGTQFSGLYFNAGVASQHLTCFFTPESDGSGGIRGDIKALSELVGAWHSLEMDYWRNGDTANGGNNYPSVALWLDNVQITSFLNAYPKSPASWINGRLNFGTRASSAQIGVAHWLGVLNGTPPNSIPGNLWIDRIAISSLGRIGP